MVKKSLKEYTKDVKRHFYDEPKFMTYGSFFNAYGMTFTAAHVLTEAGMLPPPFAFDESDKNLGWSHRLKGIDISVFGLKKSRYNFDEITEPYVNQQVIVMGYPAGSRNLEVRQGWVYLEREEGIWIAGIRRPKEPVVVGMSGGLVLGFDREAMTWQPIGVLITRNSPTDINKDGVPDHTFDFVSIKYALRDENLNLFRDMEIA